MKINKYLKELGLTWYDLPGNYISKTNLKIRLKHRWYKIKRGFCFMFSKLNDYAPEYDKLYESDAFDERNKENKEGFCEYEFYSLDYSLALYIYPRLCEFKEKYAKYGTPSKFCYNEKGEYINQNDEGNKIWRETLDKMILAFKYIIKEPDDKDFNEINAIIEEGLSLFAENYCCLWY